MRGEATLRAGITKQPGGSVFSCMISRRQNVVEVPCHGSTSHFPGKTNHASAVPLEHEPRDPARTCHTRQCEPTSEPQRRAQITLGQDDLGGMARPFNLKPDRYLLAHAQLAAARGCWVRNRSHWTAQDYRVTEARDTESCRSTTSNIVEDNRGRGQVGPLQIGTREKPNWSRC